MILAAMVVLGLIALPGLRQAIQRLRSTPRTEEQERREVMQEPISTPTDVEAPARMYWLSASAPTSLEAETIRLPLSADPVERSKQLLIALITRPPAPELGTLPAEATLLAFYIQPDGTAIADFSDELSSRMPSGILSEKLAVDSMAQTLGANKTGIRQLKILIHGQEEETLAGHLDLYGMFSVPSPASDTNFTVPTTATPVAPPSKTSPGTGTGQRKTPAPTPTAPTPGKHTPH
jgi:hypothetical protein